MFGFFRKKNNKASVTTDDKLWIESNFIWLISTFGLDRLKNKPFILPKSNIFPYKNLNDEEQFEKLLIQLCGYIEIKLDDIRINIFDDINTKQWSEWKPKLHREDINLNNRDREEDKKRYSIKLAKSNLNNPQHLTTILVHEIMSEKLIVGSYVEKNQNDWDAVIDLACIFFGFGVFMSNSIVLTNEIWLDKKFYLPSQLLSYSNALLCYITKSDYKIYIQEFNEFTNDLFKNDCEYLFNTNDTELYQEKIVECEYIYKYRKVIDDCIESRNYSEAIKASKILVELDPLNISFLFDLAYTYLQNKNYIDAINVYTKAIDIDQLNDYHYSFRGYCKLQLGDIENAYWDIKTSFEMNPDYSYHWRNMGAYYLKLKEYNKALEHFNKAYEIDPQTDLINFYFAITYSSLREIEKARMYNIKSIDKNENNDSTFVY